MIPAQRIPLLGVATGLLLAALASFSCAAPPAQFPAGRPLMADLAPDILVEATRLAPTPDRGGNRFLSGWIPWRQKGELRLVSRPEGARLELVHLEARPRTLVLDLEGLDAAETAAARVRVSHAGRTLAQLPLADPLEIPLPADLPPGRVALDLVVEGGPGLTVRASSLRPALAAGEVRRDGDDLVQSGESLVELAFPVTAGDVLLGRFQRPAEPRPEQRFELTVEDETGAELARFAWSPGWLDALRRERALRLPLGNDDGWVRVRLRARGPGPPGRWRGLAVVPKVPGTSTKVPAKVSGTSETASTKVPGIAANVPGTSPGPPRLVVVYVMDTLRADAVGHLGGRPGISPTFDRLAEEGAAFLDHQAPAPKTRPSTWALFTGQPFHAGDDIPTLAELYRRDGYRTALFSGNPNVSPAFGLDRGFEHVAEEVLFEAYGTGGGPVVNDNAEHVHAAALEWLRRLPAGERAFLYLHTVNPHSPYAPPAPFDERFTAGIPSVIDGTSATLFSIKKGRIDPSEADRRRLEGLYLGSFAYNDAELAPFLEEVTRLVPPEEIFLAVTSDHGEELFDHGGVLHGHTMYEELLHIPLVLWSPGRVEPGRVEAPTHTLDLYATLLDLIGQPPPPPTPGRSLLAAGRQGHPVRFATASYFKSDMFSARSPHWKVVWAPRDGRRWGMGEGIGRGHDAEAAFDLERDPDERLNRAGERSLELAWLRSHLFSWVDSLAAGAEGAGEPEAEVDEATRERLRALGYVE